jgi:hypothetical protein
MSLLLGLAAAGAVIFVAGMILMNIAWSPDEAQIGMIFVAIGVLMFLICGIGSAFARDSDGRYANSPLKPWFDHLASGKGLCCSFADGHAIEDADWETKDGKYRVRIPSAVGDDYEPAGAMIWLDVPEDAVITEPNRAGRTMVWPLYGFDGPSIRCFMPGSMT